MININCLDFILAAFPSSAPLTSIPIDTSWSQRASRKKKSLEFEEKIWILKQLLHAFGTVNPDIYGFYKSDSLSLLFLCHRFCIDY